MTDSNQTSQQPGPNPIEEAIRRTPAAHTEASSFITIVEDDPEAPWPWKYEDGDGRKWATEFQVRLVPENIAARFRKAHTRTSWKHGQRRDDIDQDAFGDDVVDYAIVGWDRLVMLRKTADGARQPVDVPCERQYKMLLPEHLKGQVIKLCLGKELGAYLAEGK